jgi:hypothetical protein
MAVEIENRSKRSFIIGLDDHIKGGTVELGMNNLPARISIGPGAMAQVTENCGKKLSTQYKGEIKLVRKVVSEKE